jgi:Asp-tRNA(Asn)/Glu-tRNA(Gln) amidotransferase A subunit family amidase
MNTSDESGILAADMTDLQRAFEEKRFSSEQLVEFNLSRMDRFDRKGPRLNAVISVNPEAAAEARDLDREREKSGARGPLHGITFALKDNIDTKDMPTTGGSRAMADSRPKRDAFIVEKLRKAGAVIIAKVNLHELARSGTTVGSLLGQTLNPYDLTRTPGGSSGGTAVAVAAGYCAAGLGGDTVNSIRSPASAVCLVGFRPTRGLVSRSGIIPVSLTQDAAGPLTTCVRDAAAVLEVIAGRDPADPDTREGPEGASPGYVNFLRRDGLKGKKIGITVANLGTHPEVGLVMEKAFADMEKEGAILREIRNPELDAERIIEECDVILYETKPQLNDYLRGLGPDAPVKNLAELLATGLLHESVRKGFMDAEALSDPLSMAGYAARLGRAKALRARILEIMDSAGLDALVYPHQRIPVVKIGEAQLGRNGILAAASGFPAVTVPGGFTAPSETAPLGVPVGVEFFGRPWSEPGLFNLAYGYEQATLHRRPPVL